MRLYLAGADSSGDHVALIGMKNISFLCSYWYIKNGRGWKVVNYANENGIPVFLDSGAFSAFSIGADIETKEYIDFCKEHRDKFETIAYLDAIGDHKKSMKNYEQMAEAGINGIPTYHTGEPFDFLYYLFDKWDYIAIGGLVPYLGAHTAQTYKKSVLRFLTKIHSEAAAAEKRLHGFGVTTWNLIKSFPWYSVDSSTWMSGRKFGRAMTFDGSVLRSVIARDQPEKVKNTLQTIGFNIPVSEIIPARNQGTAAYNNILRMNAEVMKFAVDRLNCAKKINRETGIINL